MTRKIQKFEVLEHQADFGILGRGKTREEAFENAGKALFSIMCDLEAISAKKQTKFFLNSNSLATLFLEFLNKLIYLKDVQGMMFSTFEVKIEENKKTKKFKLNGIAFGEIANEKKHELIVDVKAASNSQLKVEKLGKEWIAQCIVDV